MSDKAVMIVNMVINPEEMATLKEYQEKSTPMFMAAGGVFTAKYKVLESVLGDAPKMVVTMEFPNTEAIKGVFNSVEYKKLLTLRDKAIPKLDVFIGQAAG